MVEIKPNRKRQYSLRALLWLTLAASVLLGLWRTLGAELWIGIPLISLSLLPLVLLSPARRQKYLLAYLALYGPFLAMASYVLVFVTCTHCKSIVWRMLPSAPGIVPLEMARRGLDLARLSDSTGFVIAFLFSVGAVLALSRFLRSVGWWWQAAGLAMALVAAGCGALLLCAAIRA